MIKPIITPSNRKALLRKGFTRATHTQLYESNYYIECKPMTVSPVKSLLIKRNDKMSTTIAQLQLRGTYLETGNKLIMSEKLLHELKNIR